MDLLPLIQEYFSKCPLCFMCVEFVWKVMFSVCKTSTNTDLLRSKNIYHLSLLREQRQGSCICKYPFVLLKLLNVVLKAFLNGWSVTSDNYLSSIMAKKLQLFKCENMLISSVLWNCFCGMFDLSPCKSEWSELSYILTSKYCNLIEKKWKIS